MPTLVRIVPYDSKWEGDFIAAELLLRRVLGGCVLAVEHIGSTAVPGLASKPVLDVDVIVSSLRDVPEASAALIDAGFEARGNRYDDDVWAFLLRCSPPQIRAYLCPPANQTHERRILFRNYLRQHSDIALEYSALKRRLADQFPYDGDRYTSEKYAFISEVVYAALQGTK